MIVDETTARDWLKERFKPLQLQRLEYFVDLVTIENKRQNLVSPASMAAIWARHIVDSAQLVMMADELGRRWMDVGTGGGFPGLVIAICRPGPTMLVEPRRRRSDFLKHCCAELNLSHVEVRQSDVERIDEVSAVISARAVAPLDQLISMTVACSNHATHWLLPRGRYDAAEVHAVSAKFGLMFHVKQSVTAHDSAILIGSFA